MNALQPPDAAAFFLARGSSSLFCLSHSPPAGIAAVGSILHVPAFAEEMNKARRAVAVTARALASRGWNVLLLDPTGTGDSSGDFADASWETWLADVRHAAHWLEVQTGFIPCLWGLRSGCLLIDQVLAGLACPRVILWQPTISGESALAQFLRLRTMSGLDVSGAAKETTRALLAELEKGNSLDVAGYSLSSALALPWRHARINGVHLRDRQVDWLEVSQNEVPALAPPSAAVVDRLLADGIRIQARAVAGSSFWMTQEIDECPTLTSATVDCLTAST